MFWSRVSALVGTILLAAVASGCGGGNDDETVDSTPDNAQQSSSTVLTASTVTIAGIPASGVPVPEPQPEVLAALDTSLLTLTSLLTGRTTSTNAGAVDPTSPLVDQATAGRETVRIRGILTRLASDGHRFEGSLSSRAGLVRSIDGDRVLVWNCTEVDLLEVDIASGEFLSTDPPRVAEREYVMLRGADGVWRIEVVVDDSQNFSCEGQFDNEVTERSGAVVSFG